MGKQGAQNARFGTKFVLACILCVSAFVPAFVKGMAQSTSIAQRNEANVFTFDVASVRENKSGLPPFGDAPSTNVPLGPGNVYSPTGGLFMVRNFTLISYIAFAYKMTDKQLSSFKEMAPEWVSSERFNIQARTDKRDVTKDQLRLMVRSLLKERFNFSAHYEMKQVSVYALKPIKLGQTGPKLKSHSTESSCPSTLPKASTDSDPRPSETVAEGFPTTCGGIILLPASAANRVNIGGRNVTLALLANSLTGWGQLDHPVIDQTGLTGKFDFSLEYVPELRQNTAEIQTPASDMGGPTFRGALKEQLGLKLESQKGEVRVIVLDHIDHASAN